MRNVWKLIRGGVTGALVVGAATAAYAQGAGQVREPRRLSKPEMAQYDALATLVDAVTSGKEKAPSDVQLKFQPYFVKSAVNVYVPYVIEISGGRFTSFPVAVYVRAVGRPAPAPVDGKPVYAFTDVSFVDAKRLRQTGPDTVEIARGLELPPGEFDIYVAMMETAPRGRGAAAPKRVVHQQAITVPALGPALTTSSVILASQLEEAPPPSADDQLDQPFTIGGFRITPQTTPAFARSGELLFLFFVYNQAADAGDKPNVEVSYFFYRDGEEKPFSRAATSVFNATTLPDVFSVKAGHQLVVGQGVPLETFAPGKYRLEIRIADSIAKQTITRDVPFSVSE